MIPPPAGSTRPAAATNRSSAGWARATSTCSTSTPAATRTNATASRASSRPRASSSPAATSCGFPPSRRHAGGANHPRAQRARGPGRRHQRRRRHPQRTHDRRWRERIGDPARERRAPRARPGPHQPRGHRPALPPARPPRRLLAALAYNPFAIGLGVDEDTAAFIGPDNVVEVEGSGAVTVVDADGLQFSSMAQVDGDAPVCMLGCSCTSCRGRELQPGDAEGVGRGVVDRERIGPGQTRSPNRGS